MEKYLKDFEVENKNPSEETIRRWRNAVALVKNPRRRFRFVADLAKRSEAEKKKLQIQVGELWISLSLVGITCLNKFVTMERDPFVLILQVRESGLLKFDQTATKDPF